MVLFCLLLSLLFSDKIGKFQVKYILPRYKLVFYGKKSNLLVKQSLAQSWIENELETRAANLDIWKGGTPDCCAAGDLFWSSFRLLLFCRLETATNFSATFATSKNYICIYFTLFIPKKCYIDRFFFFFFDNLLITFIVFYLYSEK